jgi:hypothetical protein
LGGKPLRALGADPGQLRTRVLEEIGKHPEDLGASPPLRARRTSLRVRRDPLPDPEDVLTQLRSADENDRVRALHRVCPCGAGFLVSERFRGEVRRLRKDPSPRVRAAALHVEQDACLIEELETRLDRAEEQGWRYSDADWVRAHRHRQETRYWLPL